MSTWISKFLAALALVVPIGCSEADVSGLGLTGLQFSRSAPEIVRVAGDSIAIAGPFGYCIDRSVLQDGEAGAFVLLGSCAAITRNARDPHPAVPGFLVVTVSPLANPDVSDAAALAGLESFLMTDEGRAILSRDDTPQGIEILEIRSFEDAIFVRARDTEPHENSALAQDYWRALTAMNGRIVNASVIGFRAAPMDRDIGLETLYAFTNRILIENGIEDISL